MNDTYLGDGQSGISISDTQLQLIISSQPAMTISSLNNDIDLNTFSITNQGPFQNNIDLAGNKVVNLGIPTVSTDGVNKDYIDSRTINDLAIQTGDYNVNNNYIINVLDPIQAQQVATKNYVDTSLTSKYDNTTALNSITIATADITVGGFKITNVGDAIVGTDCLNRNVADLRYYANTTALNDIAVPNNNISMNSYQITSLADPTLSQDAVTKSYVDQLSSLSGQQIANNIVNTSKLVANQVELTNGTTPLNMNSQKITSLAIPTVASDAASKQYVDSQVVVQNAIQIANNIMTTSKLVANQIELTNGTTPLNMNSQKIISLANATVATDALSYGLSPKGELIQLFATTLPATSEQFTSTQFAVQLSNLYSKISYNNGQITLGIGMYRIILSCSYSDGGGNANLVVGLCTNTISYLSTNQHQQKAIACTSNTLGSNSVNVDFLYQVTAGTQIVSAYLIQQTGGVIVVNGVQLTVMQI